MFLVPFSEASDLGHRYGKGLGLEGLRPFLFWALVGLSPFFFHLKYPNLNETSYAKQKLSMQPGA